MRINYPIKPFAAALPVAVVLGGLLLLNFASGEEFQHAAAQPPKDNPPASKDQAETIRVGAVLYRDKCMRCHGKDGKGSDAKEDMPAIPDFTDASWHKSRTNAQLSASILDGKGKQMPSFRDRLKADQVQALLAYLRAFGPAEPPTEPKQVSDFDEEFRRLLEEMQSLKNELHELHEKKRGQN